MTKTSQDRAIVTEIAPGISQIDLQFQGMEHVIAAYLLTGNGEAALIEVGPSTTRGALDAGLAAAGVAWDDVARLLVTHIHLDHAGAAGSLVRRHPDLTVWVSEIGLPHLADPSRLERSARRLYGDLFDPLWGELGPVPERNLRVAAGDVVGWDAFPTPGHASHHVSYLRGGTLLAGDAAGVRLPGSPYVLPVSPPPDITVEGWHATVAAIRARRPERLALVHFGVHDDVDDHLDRLEAELDVWADRVGGGMGQDVFVETARADAGADADLYDRVAPFWQSWAGLARYWEKKRGT